MKNHSWHLTLTMIFMAVQPAAAQTGAPAAVPAHLPAQPMPPVKGPPKDVVDLDLNAFEKADSTHPRQSADMTPRARAEAMEARGMELRQRALAFLALYPDDPRRWYVVWRLLPDRPAFVLEWSEDGADNAATPAKVDKAAAAAWKAQVEALKAEMSSATDVPEFIRRSDEWVRASLAANMSTQERWKTGKENAPDFTAYTLENEPLKLSDYRGRVVVLDFWASWCAPCKADMPNMQALAAKYRDQGLVVLGLCSSDTREAFEKFVRQNKTRYPDILWSHDKAGRGSADLIGHAYGVTALPTKIIIDREGRAVDLLQEYSQGPFNAALARAGIEVDAPNPGNR